MFHLLLNIKWNTIGAAVLSYTRLQSWLVFIIITIVVVWVLIKVFRKGKNKTGGCCGCSHGNICKYKLEKQKKNEDTKSME